MVLQVYMHLALRLRAAWLCKKGKVYTTSPQCPRQHVEADSESNQCTLSVHSLNAAVSAGFSAVHQEEERVCRGRTGDSDGRDRRRWHDHRRQSHGRGGQEAEAGQRLGAFCRHAGQLGVVHAQQAQRGHAQLHMIGANPPQRMPCTSSEGHAFLNQGGQPQLRNTGHAVAAHAALCVWYHYSTTDIARDKSRRWAVPCSF